MGLRLKSVVVLALTCAACLTPRSMMLGQMASPVGRGAAEIGVATGIGYAQQTTPVPGSTSDARGARVWTIPAVEGNAQFGLNDRVGINAHFSSAGIQPGLKITLNRPSARAHFALLPQVAVGYAHVRYAAYATGSGGISNESDPHSYSMFTFMFGLRALISHVSGFYCGFGGDFIATRFLDSPVITNRVTTTISNSMQIAIGVNVGFSINIGWVRIRPEIAFAVNPWVQSGANVDDMPGFQGSGGFGWALMPGFSLVAATPKVTRDEGAEEDEKKMGPSEDRDDRDRDREEREERDDREERQEREE